MTTHVSENVIKKLALGGLPVADSIRVQRHLFNCRTCLRQLIEIEFAMPHSDLVTFRFPVVNTRKPLFIVHDTADGFVYCQTVKLANGKWMARNWGDELQGARSCKTMREANEHLLSAFNEMFPEHRCTERCGEAPASRAN
jgi:hypothetical protein